MAEQKTKVIIDKVRFSYVHVFQKDDNGKYSVSLIIPKDSPQIEEIKAAIAAAVKAGATKLGDNYKQSLSKVLHDGDIEKAGDEVYSGSYYLNAKSTNKPGIVKVNYSGLGGKVIEITDESEFYSGCWGKASVTFFAFNTGTNKGIACGLNNLLKTDEGDFLGGRSSAESDFGSGINNDLPDDLVD